MRHASPRLRLLRSYAALPAVLQPLGVGMPEGPCNVPVQLQPGFHTPGSVSPMQSLLLLCARNPHRYC